MARNIVDTTDRTVSLPIRKFIPKWLVISLIVACVIGVSVGGYFALNKATPTATIQKPPVQPNPVPPTASTPNQPETPKTMPVLNVAWEEIKLPPLKFGYDDIMKLSVADGGNVISVYRAIGPADNGKATRYSLWRTEDGTKTWKEVEEVVIYPEEEERLVFFQYEMSSFGSKVTPLLSEEEILQKPLNPLVDYGGTPWMVRKDGSNIFVDVRYYPFDDSLPLPKKLKDYSVQRLFLSTDEGKSWKQLNFPSEYSRFDAYPATPELTLLSETIGINKNASVNEDPDIHWIGIIASKDGSINLYMFSGKRGSFSRATIKSPN